MPHIKMTGTPSSVRKSPLLSPAGNTTRRNCQIVTLPPPFRKVSYHGHSNSTLILKGEDKPLTTLLKKTILSSGFIQPKLRVPPSKKLHCPRAVGCSTVGTTH